MEVGVIKKSIKFFVVFLMAFSVFAGGDDRDQAYYENLDEELAAFEAQLAEDLANNEALEAFQQKLADEKAAAAKSNAAYQSKLENDAKVAALMEELALEQEIAAFEAQLKAELAAQEMMAEIIAEEERAKRLAEFQAKLEAEKAAAARSNAIYQARLQQEQMIKDRQAQLALERELKAFEAQPPAAWQKKVIQLAGGVGGGVGGETGAGALQRHTPPTIDQVPAQGPEHVGVALGGVGTKIGGEAGGAAGGEAGPVPPGTQAPRIGVFGQLPPVQQVVAYLEPEGQLESATVPVPPQGLPLSAPSHAAQVGVAQLPFPPEHGRTTGAEQFWSTGALRP